MAIKGASFPTLIDAAKAMNPDGSIAKVVELMNRTNTITNDAPFLEGNMPDGHQTTVRAGLPSVAWRAAYGSVQPSKSVRSQQKDTIGEMMGYSDIDRSVVELNGNTAEFRLSEDMAFYESFTQQFADTLFYGNTQVNPERFLGLAPRFSSLSAPNARNIVNAGGSSARTSIWMVVWGPDTVHMAYPKGSTTVGLQHEDQGLIDVVDANGGRRPAYVTRFTWKAGLVLKDWRYVVRIANIDSSALATAGDAAYSGPNLIRLLVTAYNQIENADRGTPIIYANRTVVSALDNLAQAKANLALTSGEYAGKPATLFRGIPIRLVDSILNAEAAVA